MDAKPFHKLPISFIAAVVFSPTSARGKMCWKWPIFSCSKKREKVGDEKFGRGGALRKENGEETLPFFLGVCSHGRVWDTE